MSIAAIVSVGVGKWHARGVDRLAHSLKDVGADTALAPVDLLAWCGEYPPGSPSHQEMPYAFKVHAVKAARDRGYRQVFWLDSAIWAIRPVQPLFIELAQRGYCLWNGAWSIGQWATDDALKVTGRNRDRALTVPLTLGGACGFDFDHPIARELFDRWFAHAQDGSFRGAWDNKDGSCSPDPRVLGHRHDMTMLSHVAQDMQLYHHPSDFMFEYAPKDRPPHETTILLAQGML